MIIVLEGIDNSGKTTIAELLYNYLSDRGKKVSISRELTTEIGDLIKKSVNKERLSPITKAFLFAADRQIRLDQLKYTNNSEEIIIFDRYLHSAIVYREAEGLEGSWVKELNKYIPSSDFSFYIDITPEESIRRNTDTKFNIHYTLDYLDRVRNAYLNYVALGELTLIDGMRDIKNIRDKIIDTLRRNGVL